MSRREVGGELRHEGAPGVRPAQVHGVALTSAGWYVPNAERKSSASHLLAVGTSDCTEVRAAW